MNAHTSVEEAGRSPSGQVFAPESVALLALMGIKGLGLRTLSAMLGGNVRASDVLAIEDKADALELLRRLGARVEGGDGVDWSKVRHQAAEKAERTASDFAQQGIQLLLRGDPRFPPALLDAPSAPHWIFVRGAIEILHLPSIAAVGTRQPSEDGRWLSGFLGAQLGHWGVPTVSGLALGIDQLVHEWSVRAGSPTIAVLGTGILSDYPKGAESLRERILDQGGALVTEYLPRETYSAENFVKRNRLQAALGRLLVPLEWNARSGTAHTVRFATSMRRPIACLRLPDWAPDRVVFSKTCGGDTAKIFTVPGQENAFRDFVSTALNATAPNRQPETGSNPAAAVEQAAAPPAMQPSLFGQL
jgi:DNA processing protein